MSFWSSVGGFLKDNAADLVGAGVQLYGASQASKDASKAAAQQTAAAQQAMQYEQQQRAPYAGVGSKAANILSSKLTSAPGGYLRDFTMQDFEADPGYQFRMGEGIRAIEQSAAAKGKRLSGEALKGIASYGQNIAADEYGRAFKRHYAEQGTKAGLLGDTMRTGAGLGAGATPNYLASIGDAQSAATVSGGQAWRNALAGAIQPWQARSMARSYGIGV